MFARRPKITDCEDDLLAQQKFLMQKRDLKLDDVIEKVPVKKDCTKPKVEKVKKMSIFAKRCMAAQSKAVDNDSNQVDEATSYKQPTTSKLIEVSSSNPTNEDWNLFEQVIAKHSPEELMEEIKMFQNKVGPDVIAFLKNRSKNKPKESITPPISDSSVNNAAIHKTDLQIINEMNDIIKSDDNKLNSGTNKTDLPDQKLATRFGLCGEIILKEDDCLGAEFYHHDDEPERAGYTLQELFSLVRSSFNQQQDFGLKMLSCIIKKAKLGSFHGRISNGIIPVIVGGDVGTLVRLALDSPSQSIVISAVELTHALLVNTEDEVALDHVFTWHRGYELPTMNATDEDFTVNQSKESEHLKVEEVLEKDLIEGLLRMIILPRISALLSPFQNQPIVVSNLLDIIIRISRHHNVNHEHHKSPSTCDYPEYLGNIVGLFLPISKGDATGTSYPKVIKLLRVLASSDATTAVDVLDKYGDNVFQHLHGDAELGLYLESLRFFVVMLRYGLARDTFQRHIEFICLRLTALSSSDSSIGKDGATEISLLLSITDAAINWLPDNDKQNALSLDELSHGLLNLINVCFSVCKKCLSEFVCKYYIQKYTVSTVLTSSLNCLASCLEKFQDHFKMEASEFLTQAFEPCLDSMSFKRAVCFLRENSSIIPDVVEFESLRESCASFKTLGCLWADKSHVDQPTCKNDINTNARLVSSYLEVHHIQQIFPSESSSISSQVFPPSPMSPPNIRWHPVLHPLSTTPFMVAMARMTLVLSKISVDKMKIFDKVLNNEEIHSYLSKFISGQKMNSFSRNWFSRFETHFVYLLTSMSRRLLGESETCLDSTFHQRVAINLMTYLHEGDGVIASLLITDVIFNEMFFKDVLRGSAEEAAERFQSNFIVETKRSRSIDFGADILTNLSNMGGAFVEICFNGEDLKHSRDLFHGHVTRCMMVGACDKTIVKGDWLLEPLRHIYSLTNQSRKDPELYKMIKCMKKHFYHTLRAFLLFEKARPEVLQYIPNELKFARIVQAVVAAGEEIEMEATCSYLDQLLEVYGRSHKKSQHLFSTALYDSFLDQFIQYLGPIPTFQFMIILPLVLFDRDGSLWRLFWSNRSEVTRFLSLQLNQIPCDVSVLLRPKDEDDLSLIKLLYQYLRMNYITYKKTPLPYLIAIHNINHFIFSSEKCKKEEGKELDKAELFQKIYAHEINSWSEPLRTHILLYKHVNLKNDLGFEMYETLPVNRQKHFSKLANTDV